MTKQYLLILILSLILGQASSSNSSPFLKNNFKGDVEQIILDATTYQFDELTIATAISYIGSIGEFIEWDELGFEKRRATLPSTSEEFDVYESVYYSPLDLLFSKSLSKIAVFQREQSIDFKLLYILDFHENGQENNKQITSIFILNDKLVSLDFKNSILCSFTLSSSFIVSSGSKNCSNLGILQNFIYGAPIQGTNRVVLIDIHQNRLIEYDIQKQSFAQSYEAIPFILGINNQNSLQVIQSSSTDYNSYKTIYNNRRQTRSNEFIFEQSELIQFLLVCLNQQADVSQKLVVQQYTPTIALLQFSRGVQFYSIEDSKLQKFVEFETEEFVYDAAFIGDKIYYLIWNCQTDKITLKNEINIQIQYQQQIDE